MPDAVTQQFLAALPDFGMPAEFFSIAAIENSVAGTFK